MTGTHFLNLSENSHWNTFFSFKFTSVNALFNILLVFIVETEAIPISESPSNNLYTSG